MKLFINFYKKNKHFFTLFIFLILTLWFVYLKKTIVPQHIMSTGLDNKIPFIKEFAPAYYFWFIYMALGFLYLGRKSIRDFYKMEMFLSLGMVISFIIFIIYPNAQFPRPQVTGKDVFSFLVNFIYNNDGTNNVFPSIHVCNAIGVHLCLVNSGTIKDRTKFLSFTAMILICASTLFIKQHSVIDAAGGIILSGIIYLLVYKLPKLVPVMQIEKRFENR